MRDPHIASLEDLPQKRWTPREYDALTHAGILGEDDRVELIEGAIVLMTPPGPAHVNLETRLGKLLQDAAPADAVVSHQNPLACGRSRPQPDLAVIAGPELREDRLPRSALLVVEVSDSSLPRDRLKARIYAAAGIPEMWIVDVAGRTVEVHRDPMPRSRRYRSMQLLVVGDILTSPRLPRLRLPVATLFARRH